MCSYNICCHHQYKYKRFSLSATEIKDDREREVRLSECLQGTPAISNCMDISARGRRVPLTVFVLLQRPRGPDPRQQACLRQRAAATHSQVDETPGNSPSRPDPQRLVASVPVMLSCVIKSPPSNNTLPYPLALTTPTRIKGRGGRMLRGLSVHRITLESFAP